jgi:hypothetical protein
MSPTTVYLYELRRGEEIIATGQLTHDQPLEIGQRLRSPLAKASSARSSPSAAKTSTA